MHVIFETFLILLLLLVFFAF